ncbi:hypothetical protein BGE01nite_31010 [Brevifollis gellanilyticus]|uniref:Uncharacterized protein n=2 Tax=Brevifollis gellanilyticus TaxID=748831 RepID=A0A512MAQ5_9BACT|nr:hypothetical protein BGE01nite_31010 [Brevifollis gellanilyticus]
MAATIKETGMTFAMIQGTPMLLRCLLGLLSVGALGFISGCFAAAIVSIFLIPWRSHVNGGPFKVGDQVQIINGHHRGTVTRIYALWQGNTFRVELGLEAKAAFKDIFTQLQVMRVN